MNDQQQLCIYYALLYIYEEKITQFQTALNTSSSLSISGMKLFPSSLKQSHEKWTVIYFILLLYAYFVLRYPEGIKPFT